MRNPFVVRSNTTFTRPENQSMGILDDYSQRKAIKTQEIEAQALMVRMIAGETIVKGNVLRSSRVADNTALLTGTTDGEDGRDMPIGISYENASIGSSFLLIVSGKADILNDGVNNVVRGDLVIASATISGAALVSAEPEVPATVNHWREVGHAIESRTGAGLFKSIIHFN